MHQIKGMYRVGSGVLGIGVRNNQRKQKMNVRLEYY